MFACNGMFETCGDGRGLAYAIGLHVLLVPTEYFI
jgi:hypothetical protein